MKLRTILIILVVVLIAIWLFDKAIPGHRGCPNCPGPNWSAPGATTRTCPNA